MATTYIHLSCNDIIADEKEVARYLGYRPINAPSPEISMIIKDVISKMRPCLMPQAVYDEFNLFWDDNKTLNFAGIKIKSRYLEDTFKGCTKIVIMAATIGPQVDALIRRTQKLDTTRASIMQAAGAMFVESFVDFVNDKIKETSATFGFKASPRFSAGYGDVPLTLQKNIFEVLPCARIGLTLMDTLIMAPEKSVTAFIGLKPI